MARVPRKKRLLLAILLTLVLVGMVDSFVKHSVMADWRTANRESAGIAPDPELTSEAVVQVYVARAFSWRGWFGVHTWIATKATGADAYTVYQVVGWRVFHGGGDSAVAIGESAPDRRWFGSDPKIIVDLRGDGVDEVIKRIDGAARRYPYADQYVLWPGPNSNTFTAYIGREVPELKLDLPPTAIGKDFLTNGRFFDASPSRTGYQVSLYGLFGLLAGVEEGLEINILGLTFGVDAKDLALKLPVAGRVGFQEN
ncbi:MAG: DUF3750 domain-containing protein [Alphaproteobacteria bacterium]|nr:DUF3750 domain-containing protein [Alphaproteobacteria bacterium]MBT7943991.1 DUF3750 domain-containing protein [Alphaproteobacteria bacterium]